jgi:hypothetical protein
VRYALDRLIPGEHERFSRIVIQTIVIQVAHEVLEHIKKPAFRLGQLHQIIRILDRLHERDDLFVVLIGPLTPVSKIWLISSKKSL